MPRMTSNEIVQMTFCFFLGLNGLAIIVDNHELQYGEENDTAFVTEQGNTDGATKHDEQNEIVTVTDDSVSLVSERCKSSEQNNTDEPKSLLGEGSQEVQDLENINFQTHYLDIPPNSVVLTVNPQNISQVSTLTEYMQAHYQDKSLVNMFDDIKQQITDGGHYIEYTSNLDSQFVLVTPQNE